MKTLDLEREDSYDDLRLPVTLAVTVRPPAPDSLGSLRQLARVQIVASITGVVAILAFAYRAQDANLASQLPRVLALLTTSLLTEQAFAESDRFWVTTDDSLTLSRIAAALQVAWLLSEAAFNSAFAPLLTALAPSLSFTFAGALALRFLPATVMISVASCLELLTKLRLRRRNRQLASMERGDFSQLAVQQQQTAINICATSYMQPLSPVDSMSSRSSGENLHSELPSPTGHCPSPDHESYLRHAAAAANGCNMYFMQYTLDTNESMVYVHKKLRPIKTSSPTGAAAYKVGNYNR